MHTPLASREMLRDHTLTTHNEHPTEEPAIRTIRFVDAEANPGDSVVEENLKTWKSSSRAEISPSTPGVDDTPYIQFAIDQLTRDEELTGRRRDGRPSGDVSPIEEEPERIFRNDDLIEQPEPVSPQEPEKRLSGELVPPLMPRGMSSGSSPAQSSINQLVTATEDVLVPADPPRDTYRYPLLNFIPSSLRIPSIAGLITSCLLMIAALIVSSVWASKHDGLIAYDGLSTSVYFLFEFVPQMLGSIIVLWLLHVQTAAQRILPFTLLASGKRTQHARSLHEVPLFLTNLLLPNLSSFRHGEPLLGFCSIIFWLSLFTIPLLSCLYQTRFYMSTSQGVWTWTTVQPISWTLIILYSLLVIALILLALRLRSRTTGLKWDPVSLADIFVLLGRSNVTVDFIPSRPASLGYWQASNRPGDVFYGIGEDHSQGYPTESEKVKSRRQQAPMAIDLEGQRPSKGPGWKSLPYDLHSPAVRYRWTPWFMRDSWWILWLVLALVLMIAFLAVSFVHQAVAFGFLPLLPAPTTSLGFSPANFLYSFLPSLLGMILFLVWQPIDMYHRALEPFARLANPRGETAEQTLLLGYTACAPVEVTIRAALAGHYRVAWISFVALLSITLPILGGGIFTAEFNVPAQEVREVAAMPAYYALVVFIIIYALSFLALWPEPKRHLPHDIRTVGDLASYVYQSRITSDTAFREPRTKTDLVTRLVSVAPGEREIPRYAFGVYVGRDGKEHLGIDRVHRPGTGEMVVTTARM